MAASGWYSDPAGRHEHRYYDGTSWTEHVADQGRVTADPLDTPPVRVWPVQSPPPARPVGGEGGTPPQSPPPLAGGKASRASADASLKKLGKWTDRSMRDAAAWVVQRRGGGGGADQPVLDREPSDAVLGQWSGLAHAVQKYVVATSGVAGGSELVGVLGAITGSEDAQGRLLRSIDAKVDALVKGPYNTGRTYLREAQRLGPDDPAVRDHLERAKDAFYMAHGQAVSVQSRSLVEYHLGLSWLLLGRRDDAVHWLAQSHASALAVIDELARCTTNVKVLRSQAGTAAAAWFYPAGVVVVGMKFKKMVAAERARQALVEFLPFVTCTARCHNSLVDDPARLPGVSLVSTGDNEFELVPHPL